MLRTLVVRSVARRVATSIPLKRLSRVAIFRGMIDRNGIAVNIAAQPPRVTQSSNHGSRGL